MIQTFIIVVLVGFSAVYLIRTLVSSLRGKKKNGCSSCGKES